jgi:hypothetical protein
MIAAGWVGKEGVRKAEEMEEKDAATKEAMTTG